MMSCLVRSHLWLTKQDETCCLLLIRRTESINARKETLGSTSTEPDNVVWSSSLWLLFVMTGKVQSLEIRISKS